MITELYRGQAEKRHHGVDPSLIGDPTLPALAIPVGGLIGISPRHDISPLQIVLKQCSSLQGAP